MTVPVKSMKFWIHAFIPRTISSYTKPIPGRRGETMIPHPATDYWGYHTDQRSFDPHIHASHRMHSEIRVDFTSGKPKMTSWHHCGETIEVIASSGAVSCRARAPTTRMTASQVSAGPPFVASLRCAASNPCSPSSRVFGDIDYVGRVIFDPSARTVEFNGTIDEFPAFEAYATINDGAGEEVFAVMPKPGTTVGSLPGGAVVPIRRRVGDVDGDGIIDSSVP